MVICHTYALFWFTGTSQHSADVLHFTSLSYGGSCVFTDPPTCTAIKLSMLLWRVHESVNYFVSIKAANSIGLFVMATGAYTHYSESPSDGVVFDVDPDEHRQVWSFCLVVAVKTLVLQLKRKCLPLLLCYLIYIFFQFLDIEDIDFQNSKVSVSSKWLGFKAVHSSVTFNVCILDECQAQIICEHVYNDTSHTFNGVLLTPYKVRL